MSIRRLFVLSVVAFGLVAGPTGAATVDGATIHWTSAGTGAKTIVLVHGWTCDETSWSEQVPALAKKYRVITVDLPGHGKATPRRTASSRWISSPGP